MLFIDTKYLDVWPFGILTEKTTSTIYIYLLTAGTRIYLFLGNGWTKTAGEIVSSFIPYNKFTARGEKQVSFKRGALCVDKFVDKPGSALDIHLLYIPRYECASSLALR